MLDRPDSAVHKVAATGFNAEAQAYQRTRPSYPADRAMAELARVIRPGGHLGLVWNARDRSVEWVDRVWSVMDRMEKHAPWRDHRDGTAGSDIAHRWTEDTLIFRGPWTPFERATFTHVHHITTEQVIDRMRSVSHIATLPPTPQTAILDEIRTILREHPDTRDTPILGIPYRVDAMITRLLS